ncbi:MAG: hypothetical protein HFG16_03445 [Erysipelotrichaceae bacterium]|jgi:hypothetical protein|nr:hypothetical protein [Erysipelotrichaceae bacterium]
MQDIQRYFHVDEDAFYRKDNGDRGRRSIHNRYDKTRVRKAEEQSRLEPVAVSEVLVYVNEFLNFVKLNNGASPTVRVETITLDDEKQLILDNGIVAVGCSWMMPVYDKGIRKYSRWDGKYDEIQKVFHLRDVKNIVWIKFTVNGRVGVVAQSFDINFAYDTTSGKLVHDWDGGWDTSFVLIFPLTEDILQSYSREEMETAIGNYLIEKKVPIIDYYSHNY